MPFDLLDIYSRLPLFALIVCRLGGVVMFLPMIGGLAVPFRIRALLVMGLSAMVAPFVNPPTQPPDIAGVALAMSGEVLIGVLIGLTLRGVFMAVQMGGQIIAQEAGVAYGQAVDPTFGEDQSVFATFYLQLGGIVFLAVGGHRALLAACLDSFETIPLLGDTGVFDAGVTLLTDALTVGAGIAFRVAAPTLITLFLLNIALGFLAKTIPQMNVTILGFSLKSLVGLLLIAVSLPMGIDAFVSGVDDVNGWITDLLVR
ncbi:MAG: flagellar biosynthetic protein FliR [Phycisphaerales bacterium]|nr:flagellar biosynthetic protein FliR [Phycisphaerales bacterium]